MKTCDINGRRSTDTQTPQGIIIVPPTVLKGEPRSGTSENPRQENQIGPKVSQPGGGRVQKNGEARVEGQLCPKPHGADRPMARLAPGVKSYPLPLSHCEIKQWRNLRPSRWPSEMPWSSPILLHVLGGLGAGGGRTEKMFPYGRQPKPRLIAPAIGG